MRPHGRANISRTNPRALGICQRCGFMYNHDQLRWQYEYGGMRLINLRILVCEPCYDTPQIQLRTILLPPDPTPIEFPTPEQYAADDNPMGIGYVARDSWTIVPSTYGTCIGTLTQLGGLNAAFDGNINKQYFRSAYTSVSANSSANTIGKSWNASLLRPSVVGVSTAPLTYNISAFAVCAPIDMPIFHSATNLSLQGSNDGATWTTLYSTTTTGVNGEQIASVSSNFLTGSSANYQYHEISIQGDGSHSISVSQVQFSVTTTGQNEQ